QQPRQAGVGRQPARFGEEDARRRRVRRRRSPPGPRGRAGGQRADFAELTERIRPDLGDVLTEVLDKASRVLVLWRKVSKKVRGTTSLAVLPSLDDVQGQLGDLVKDGFLTETGLSRLDDVHRYLRGVEQ